MARKITPNRSRAKNILSAHDDDIVVNGTDHQYRNGFHQSTAPKHLKALDRGFHTVNNTNGKRNNKAHPMVLSRRPSN